MAETNPKITRPGCIVSAAVLAAIVLIGWLILRPAANTTPAAPAAPTVSEVGVLSIGDGSFVALGVTKDDFDAMTKAAVAKDDVGWRELLVNGRMFTVTEGTKARVIDRGLAWRQVRVLEGPSEGKSGFIPMEWIKNAQ